jgi:protein-L-isoaspartate(D-aspartate) O-methyltransferase
MASIRSRGGYTSIFSYFLTLSFMFKGNIHLYKNTTRGHVTGIEYYPSLVKYGRNNIAKYPLLKASIVSADNHLGLPGNVFDRILVSASAKDFPSELLDQLSP